MRFIVKLDDDSDDHCDHVTIVTTVPPPAVAGNLTCLQVQLFATRHRKLCSNLSQQPEWDDLARMRPA